MIRLINVAAFIFVAVLAVTLYRAKTEAHADRERADALAAEVAIAIEDVEVLRAELAHLENPQRLSALAEEELGLRPIDPLRVVTLDEAPLFLSARAWRYDPDERAHFAPRLAMERRR